MKAKIFQKSKKKAPVSSQKGRKSRETERPSIQKGEKNPLYERLKGGNDGDKRKNRREFFTEQTESKSRPPRERNFKDRDTEHKSHSHPKRNFKERDTEHKSRPHQERNFKERNTERKSRPYQERNFKERDTERKSRPYHERNFKEKDTERKSRPYQERDFKERDTERKSRPPRERNFKERDTERKSRPYQERNFKERTAERTSHPPQERKLKERKAERGMELEIVRDIIYKRRATGRRSARTPKVLSLSWSEDRGAIRLNKYIANSGICSRREADDLITAGAVTVNGEIVTELGTKVMPTDEIRYEDKILQREKPIYILLNKPKDYITTTEDDRGRDNVMMLIEGACQQRVYPVGRLDRNTTGLLLFTNDGEMTKKMTHPRFGIKKIYQIELDKDLKIDDFETLKNGIELEDGFMQPDELEYVEGKKILGITLHSGKNRIVRRLFRHLGYEVEKLDRVYYAGLTKKNLSRGQWRILRQDEINILKMSV